MTTISVSTTLGINLNPASYTNPIVIDAGVTVSYAGLLGNAINGYDEFIVIQNDGTISGPSVGGNFDNVCCGVYLDDGGSVTNAASASITAGYSAVQIVGGAGTVVNDGSVAGTGTHGRGVFLFRGGSVNNAASASIAGELAGVVINYSAGTVANDGTITSGGVAVYLDGGLVTNAASASITGGVHGAGTVVNDGSIAASGTNEANVVVKAPGASVTNAASASITGGFDGVEGGNDETVVNDGTIASGGEGVNLNGGLVTNAASALIMGGFHGVYVSSDVGTVVNDGTIDGGGGSGVDLSAGGSVTNVASGSITGFGGVGFLGSVGTVVNDGTIASTDTNGPGIFFDAGGSVTNAASASIAGGAVGVEFNGINISGTLSGGAGTVVNGGSITGTGTNGIGVVLRFGGSVTNSASASITGDTFGVSLPTGGALTNAGTITGSAGPAVYFGGTGSNLLVLDPGFGFSGLVTGSMSASNTLELASAASAGAVAGLGTEFINFGSIVFDVGAGWSVSGGTSALAGGQVITGFTNADTIDLVGVIETIDNFALGTLSLTGSAALDLLLPGSFTTGQFSAAPSSDGTAITVACFAAGARILTAFGEVPVEELRIGDQVATLRGHRLAPIVWLGHRYLDCLRHPRPDDVRPICVKADTIADGVPHRDLWLSPEHAVLLRTEEETVLVPIRHLLNGTTIAQVPSASVTYWHVELASHDAIVAEGLPAETYLDTGNRADFANGGPAVTVHPTFADAVWHAKACAPQLRYGDALAALQYRLATRAARIGGVQLVRSQTA